MNPVRRRLLQQRRSSKLRPVHCRYVCGSRVVSLHGLIGWQLFECWSRQLHVVTCRVGVGQQRCIGMLQLKCRILLEFGRHELQSVRRWHLLERSSRQLHPVCSRVNIECRRWQLYDLRRRAVLEHSPYKLRPVISRHLLGFRRRLVNNVISRHDLKRRGQLLIVMLGRVFFECWRLELHRL